jgi:CheY-like chemotaxis protein/nitrogen-specific signal transduction histidine kinase
MLAQQVEARTADLVLVNKELAHAVRARDEFLAMMSHELRTPLHAILTLSESLQEGVYGQLNEGQNYSLHTIEESGRHLLELINDILDIAKIESGKVDLHIETLVIEQTCLSSLKLVREAARKKNLNISHTIDETMTTMQADKRRLKQMLVNLLSNAIKFTPDGGSIGLDVVTDAENNVIRFSVWDTGIGIREEDTHLLFQPFVQLDSSLARQYQGTGLGLVMVARLAELHGGSVALESTFGAGSRFTILLPMLQEEARLLLPDNQETLPAIPPTDSLASPPSRILLVDDNESNAAGMGDYLRARGYRVLVAHDGMQAIEMSRQHRPDLILMDIQMPVMDGLEAIRRIRAIDRPDSVPIIALTSMAMPGDRERCLAAGANDYLPKPVSMRSLVQIIEKHLARGMG